MQKVSVLIIILQFLLLFSCEDNTQDIPDPKPNDEPVPVAEGHYRNPITVEREAEFLLDGGVADPAVFRWMGKYYLMTTQFYIYGTPGMQIWVSDNLADWKFLRTIQLSGFTWEMLWSPEMYYYRGSFYIYYSGPSGHLAMAKYELPENASNPEPFSAQANWKVISENFLQLNDHAIDGSILIEPNGDKYAFFSGLNGVKYRRINSMDDGNGSSVMQLSQCSVENIKVQPGEIGTEGWTEAPTAFKYNGKYYLTYTGNHFLRPDYQIHLSVGNSLNTLQPIESNPWITNITGDWTATGNCYPIIGPNLKEYYYTYHVKEGSRITPSNQQVLRKLMLDKVEFAETTIETDAPTFTDRLIPAKAEYSAYFNNNLADFEIFGNAATSFIDTLCLEIENSDTDEFKILAKQNTSNNFVAEANFKLKTASSNQVSKIGFIHAGNDNSTNLFVGLKAENASVSFIINDGVTEKTINLPDFNPYVWFDLRIEKVDANLKLFINNVEAVTETVKVYPNGKIGYLSQNCTSEIGFMAFSNL